MTLKSQVANIVDQIEKRADELPEQVTDAKKALARKLFDLALSAQARGWSAEDMLRAETKRQERQLRKKERLRAKS